MFTISLFRQFILHAAQLDNRPVVYDNLPKVDYIVCVFRILNSRSARNAV